MAFVALWSLVCVLITIVLVGLLVDGIVVLGLIDVDLKVVISVASVVLLEVVLISELSEHEKTSKIISTSERGISQLLVGCIKVMLRYKK